jgi:hypothetical protein
MIKLGKEIRLTRRELSAFRSMTGEMRPPRTVEEHNAALEQAAEAWRNEVEGPESTLLQRILLTRLRLRPTRHVWEGSAVPVW